MTIFADPIETIARAIASGSQFTGLWDFQYVARLAPVMLKCIQCLSVRCKFEDNFFGHFLTILHPLTLMVLIFRSGSGSSWMTPFAILWEELAKISMETWKKVWKESIAAVNWSSPLDVCFSANSSLVHQSEAQYYNQGSFTVFLRCRTIRHFYVYHSSSICLAHIRVISLSQSFHSHQFVNFYLPS